jgi:hypothetical protein
LSRSNTHVSICAKPRDAAGGLDFACRGGAVVMAGF